MKFFWIFSSLIIFLFLTNVALAKSEYGSIDVYYNNKFLDNSETAKPILKIGEPFRVKINLTVFQKSDVYFSLSCVQKESFKIIEGPTTQMEEYSEVSILDPNCSKEYEWILKPTDRWKGGSLPLDVYYTILAHGGTEPLVNSGFTIIYPYISNEYYEEKNSESENHQIPEVETPVEMKSPPASVSTPAFTFIGSIFTAALVFALAHKKL
jgi:MAST domain-containing protein